MLLAFLQPLGPVSLQNVQAPRGGAAGELATSYLASQNVDGPAARPDPVHR